MRVDKVILRAALSTLAAILVLMSFMVFTLSFLYPSTMMEITYDLGMDASSVRCAKRAYSQSGNDVYFIAYATEVAIGADDYAKIEECGELLIADEQFEEYCAERNAALSTESYDQYVLGQVCLAKYRLEKSTDAVAKAYEWLYGTFPPNNALAALGITALTEGDTLTASAVKEKMDEMNTASLSGTDLEYYGKIMSVLENALING